MRSGRIVVLLVALLSIAAVESGSIPCTWAGKATAVKRAGKTSEASGELQNLSDEPLPGQARIRLAKLDKSESALVNGIYSAEYDLAKSGTLVKRADHGGQVKVQELLTRDFGKAKLVSLSNDNDYFELRLEEAGPFQEDSKTVHQAIYIDGVCIMASSGDPDKEKRRYLSGIFNSLENAQKVAKALSIEPQLRKHPGHKLLVSCKPTRESFPPADPTEGRQKNTVQDSFHQSNPTITLTIKNVGDTTVCFIAGGSQRGPRDNQFAFIARENYGYGKAVPDTGDPTNFGGMGSIIKLKPGEVFTKTVDLSDWFKFTEPGTYAVTCIYHLELNDENGIRFPALWDEYATAKCDIHIEK